MSDHSRTELFWRGTKGRNAAKVAARQEDKRLQDEMASKRIKAQYRELKDRAERRGDPPGTQAVRKDDARSGSGSTT